MEILRMNLAALVGRLEPVPTVPQPAGSVVSRRQGRPDVVGLSAANGLP